MVFVYAIAWITTALGVSTFIVFPDVCAMSYKKIKEKLMLDYNEMYECEKCKVYFRKYQYKLYYAANGIKSKENIICPHCKHDILTHPHNIKKILIKHYPEYLDIHPTCPKLNTIKDHINMKKSIRLYKEKIEINEQQREYEDYQKKTQDDPLKWLKNIQGDDKL